MFVNSIKLRIPLFLFLMGFASGVVQLMNLTSLDYIITVCFFAFMGLSIYICEKIGLNEKKVNPLIAFAIIIIGIGIDLFTVTYT
ncbi:putative hypothetical protein [Paenibacillus agaridevorans]|jgi:uncharacterized membrane protein YoaK (UPF0700 family)|uniref:Uncharacterized protein n=1 Tax=Paenibacillus agaridevorans TaxID=171404 RepID=A0A2R5F0L3_9BACL|nr:putative hypothetical protein [Paenibacillus agaridevorans]